MYAKDWPLRVLVTDIGDELVRSELAAAKANIDID
jgi:hypothetical protein